MFEGLRKGIVVKISCKQVLLLSRAVAPATVALAVTAPVEETSPASRKRSSGESRACAFFKKAKIGDDGDHELLLE